MKSTMQKSFEKFEEDYFDKIEKRIKQELQIKLEREDIKLKSIKKRLLDITNEVDIIIAKAVKDASLIVSEAQEAINVKLQASAEKEKIISKKLSIVSNRENELKSLLKINKEKEKKVNVILKQNLEKEKILNNKLEKIKELNAL